MVVEASGIPNFEGGKVVLSTGDVQVLRVELSSTHIDVDVEDKKFIKRIIAMREDLTPKLSETDEAANSGCENPPQIGSIFSTARSVAETLRKRGITITLSYKGKRMATIGAEANPTILHRITKTRGIAINSIFTAIRMVI
jgi:hypothetical protein